MTPIGPYASPWTAKPHFVVSGLDSDGKTVVFFTVANGTPRNEGTKHPTLRDAKRWMADNGFELKRM